MSKEAEELAKQLLAIADDLQDEWDGGDHADIFDQITARYIDRISSLIDDAFARVWEECAEMATEWYRDDCGGCGGQCDGACSHIDSLRAAILGTEAKD